MEGVRYLTDENGKRVAVQLDLETYGDLWEDIEDVIVAQSRATEETVSLEKAREYLVKQGKLCEHARR